MNRRWQFITITVVSLSTIIMFSFSLIKNNDGTKIINNETAETEKGIPTHKGFNSLLIIDINGPFTIEYLYTKNNVDYIKIADSSPQGRMNALHWLRVRGIDPTDLNIRFDDFTNPLKSRGD